MKSLNKNRDLARFLRIVNVPLLKEAQHLNPRDAISNTHEHIVHN